MTRILHNHVSSTGIDAGAGLNAGLSMAPFAPAASGGLAAPFIHDSNVTTYHLTKGVDNLVLTTPNNLVVGTFGTVTAQGNETGGSISIGDSIDGGASDSTTLSVSQNHEHLNNGRPYDVLPPGLNIQNVQTFLINSVQALGTANEYFNTTNIDSQTGGLALLDVNTSSGEDYIQVSNATSVLLNDDGGLKKSDPGNVTLLGGFNVTVTAGLLGQAQSAAVVSIGSAQQGTLSPSGTVSVTNINQLAGSNITVYGGTKVTVSGYSGIDLVGGSGAVTVTENSASTVAAGIVVQGGSDVSIDNIAGAGNNTAITVGSGGGEPDPYGNISIIDANASQTSYANGVVSVYSNGGSVVTIVGGSAGGITDISGVLGTVSLTGVSGTENISAYSLSQLNITNSGEFNGGLLNPVVNEGNGNALTVGLNADAMGTGLTDNNVASVGLVVGSAGATLALAASSATSLAVSGNGTLAMTGAAGLGALRTLTISGAASFYDGGTLTGLTNYASLRTIDGSGTTGALTVALNANEAFTGGSGANSVVISADALSTIYGGSGPNNALVVNAAASAFTASNTGTNVSGFSILRTVASASGTYDLAKVFNNISNVQVTRPGKGAITFSNASTNMSLWVTESIGSNGVTVALPANNKAPATLALALGAPTTAGIDTSNGGGGLGSQLLGAQGYGTINVTSNGATSTITGQSLGTNYVALGDTSLTALTISGVENLTIGSNGNSLSTIDASKAAGSATIDLSHLGLTAGGVTVTDGAAGLVFAGNVSSIKTDLVQFATANYANNVITEGGTGALVVQGINGGVDNGNNTIQSNAGVLLVTVGDGNNKITGSDATTTITAGNGNNQISIGKSNSATLASQITVGTGNNTITLIGKAADTVSIAAGSQNANGAGSATLTVGNGANNITAGAGHYVFTIGDGNNTISANVGVKSAGGVTIGGSAGGNNHITVGGGATDSITVGNGANMVDLSSTTGSDTVAVGSGSNAVTLGSGASTVVLDAVNASASVYTDISGAIANDSIDFLVTNGTGVFYGGSAQSAQVQLPKTATFSDYLNAACSANGAANSVFTWFDFGGNQFIVEDNSNAGTFIGGVDTIVELNGTSLNLGSMTLNHAGDVITFH